LRQLEVLACCDTQHEITSIDQVLISFATFAQVPTRTDAVIIGAGPSGLATAVLLGRRGYRVLVVEQHDRPGGGLHSFEEKGFEFDTGFHYVGEMEVRAFTVWVRLVGAGVGEGFEFDTGFHFVGEMEVRCCCC
jgi:NADPH-dependent 2,4-dienoyl-CoA reductase/sulfur reductase-like enzyme